MNVTQIDVVIQTDNVLAALQIVTAIMSTISVTILGMRCKCWKTARGGFMASIRPSNSTPSPGSATQVIIDKQ